MKLSVIIVNWNTAALLRACLLSLRKAVTELAGGAEVIVVDNASSDGSAAMVRGEFPEVRLIANDRNAGYAAGNNQGLRMAQGEAVLLLNPDTEVPAGALERLLNVLEAHPDVGAVAPRLIGPDGRPQASVRGFPAPGALLAECLGLAALFPRSRRLGSYRLRHWPLDDERDVDQPMMSCLLIRRQALDDVGLLDEAFPIFFNDVDWCYRARQRGWRIRFTPRVDVLHHGGASTSQVRRDMIRESGRSLERFYQKHYRGRLWAPVYALALLAIRAGTLLRLAWCALRGAGRRPFPRWQVEAPAMSSPQSAGAPAPGPCCPGEVDLVVSIVNWNTRDDLICCLHSIYRQASPEGGNLLAPDGSQEGGRPVRFLVAVVDNASADGSADRVAECFPQAVLVRNRENRGFGAAHNQVLKGSGSRYVFLLNPDAEMQPGSLAALVRFMDENPDVGICGPLVLNPDGTVQYSARRFPTLLAGAFRNTLLGRLFPNNRFTRDYLLSDWDHRTQRDVDWVSGAAMMIRREVIEQVGVFDERFFMYSEDVDLCYRAHEAGWRVTFFPGAVITHARAHSSDQAQVRMLVQFHRSMYRFWQKHYAPRSPWPVRLLAPVGIGVRLALMLTKNLSDRIRGKLHR